eukprot:RCo052954
MANSFFHLSLICLICFLVVMWVNPRSTNRFLSIPVVLPLCCLYPLFWLCPPPHPILIPENSCVNALRHGVFTARLVGVMVEFMEFSWLICEKKKRSEEGRLG